MEGRRKIFLTILLIIIVTTSYGIGYLTTNALKREPPKNLEILPSPQEASKKLPEASTTANSLEVAVVKVIDGDTIEIEGGKRVRYIGVNTPETSHPTLGKECYGEQAKAANKMLVENQKVRLEKDISETDRYDRLLRYVYVGDVMVNDYLVREGFAFSSSYPPDIKYQDQFVEAQRVAFESGKGFWSACQVSSDKESILGYQIEAAPSESSPEVMLSEPTAIVAATITAPVDTPEITKQPTLDSSAPESSNSLSDCKIKGNISSSGKIYHLMGCNSYEKTVINIEDGEKWFCSEQEAVAAGWRKAKNC